MAHPISLAYCMVRIVAVWIMVFIFSSVTVAQTADVKRLKALSIEELMNIEVTSVSRGPMRLSETASAIQVITTDDIKRSGAASIPEALRLATNLQVAQLNSSAWIISARGFNTIFANKLLVLIDGRTVYTPLFGGVLWELQSVLLEDVERIEVISGPGGTLWGANAVNGVINIITKNAKDTQGLYVTAAVGSFLERQVAARYGFQLNEKTHARVYAQHAVRDNTVLNDSVDNIDSWETSQAGFSIAHAASERDNFTLQGDVYWGYNQSAANKLSFDGQNLLARWVRTVSEKSELALQLYYDRYWRDDPASLGDELITYDADFQYRFSPHARHTFLAGVGFRLVDDNVVNRSFAGIIPAHRTMPMPSAFIQDEITVAKNLKVTVGSKFLNNIYSGFEIQPSVRAAWTRKGATVWGAVSRAIRAPSRFDVDYKLPLEPQPPTVPSVAGGPNFDSEKLHAYELGYKIQPHSKLSLSISTFYNDYDYVYSVEALPGTFTYQIQNGSDAETWGAEFSGVFQLKEMWRIRGGFTYFNKDLRARPGHVFDPRYLSNDSKHRVLLQSMLDLPGNFSLDIVARYSDYIHASLATTMVPAYFTFDSRVAWQYRGVEVSVVGQNLYRSLHSEFGSLQIPRSVYGRVTLRLN